MPVYTPGGKAHQVMCALPAGVGLLVRILPIPRDKIIHVLAALSADDLIAMGPDGHEITWTGREVMRALNAGENYATNYAQPTVRVFT